MGIKKRSRSTYIEESAWGINSCPGWRFSSCFMYQACSYVYVFHFVLRIESAGFISDCECSRYGHGSPNVPPSFSSVS